MDEPIPDEQSRREAKNNPGGWVYALDANCDPSPNADVPRYRTIGCWKVDEQGNLTGEFLWHPSYRRGSNNAIAGTSTAWRETLAELFAGYVNQQTLEEAAEMMV